MKINYSKTMGMLQNKNYYGILVYNVKELPKKKR